jgi:hypothetical protein
MEGKMAIIEWDEFYIHQTAGFINEVDNDDPHAFERTFIGCHSADGEVHLMMGLGAYPNVNVMDGFICVRYKNVQRNIRISRHMQDDRPNTVVGPLTLKVIDPLKRGGLYLSANDYKIECSLEFEGRTKPLPRPRPANRSLDAPVRQAGFDQGLRYKGSIIFEDQNINADDFIGVRDRTWGIRKPGTIHGLGFYLWPQVHFSTFYLNLFIAETMDGLAVVWGSFVNDDGSEIPIVEQLHRIEFVPGFRSYSKIELMLKGADGKKRHLICNPLSPECYMKGGGYEDLHGKDRGPFLIEGECWDVSTPAAIDSPMFGMHQRDNNFEMDGEKGAGLIESMFNQSLSWDYKPSW